MQVFVGRYFDGQTPAPQEVRAVAEPRGLRLTWPDGASAQWPYGALRQTQGFHPGEPVRLEHGPEPGESLVVSTEAEALLAALRRAAPGARFHNPATRARWMPLTLAGLVVTVGLGVGLYLWGIPALADTVARRIPLSWEERLGQTVSGSLAPADQRCTEPARQQAVEAVLAALTKAAPPSPYRFRVAVADDPAVNAFAAPGGYVIVNAGLLRHTKGPAELAGVLAHEVQHVLKRHSTRGILRQLTYQALFAVATGSGDLAQLVGTAGALRYSREDEAEADREGMALLQAARLDPQGMVRAFEMLKAQGPSLPGMLAYLSTHPDTDARLAALSQQAAQARYQPVPLLPGVDWKQVRASCK